MARPSKGRIVIRAKNKTAAEDAAFDTIMSLPDNCTSEVQLLRLFGGFTETQAEEDASIKELLSPKHYRGREKWC
jgi:hypothetical protein